MSTGMQGRLVAFVTVTRVEWMSDDSDDYTEKHGWVDASSPTDLEESRNYVRPLFSDWCNYVRVPGGVELENPISDQLREAVREAMESAPGGAWRDNADGTYYGEQYLEEAGANFSYCVHWHVKHFERGEWRETPVSVSEILTMGRYSLLSN